MDRGSRLENVNHTPLLSCTILIIITPSCSHAQGSAELREVAAEALGQLVEVVSEDTLRPYVIQVRAWGCVWTLVGGVLSEIILYSFIRSLTHALY